MNMLALLAFFKKKIGAIEKLQQSVLLCVLLLC